MNEKVIPIYLTEVEINRILECLTVYEKMFSKMKGISYAVRSGATKEIKSLSSKFEEGLKNA